MYITDVHTYTHTGAPGPQGPPGRGSSPVVKSAAMEAPRALGLAQQDNSDVRALEVRVSQMAMHMRQLSSALAKLQVANARLKARQNDESARGVTQPVVPMLASPMMAYPGAVPMMQPMYAAAPVQQQALQQQPNALPAMQAIGQAHPELGIQADKPVLSAKARCV
jgi:hypothetical protein